LKKLNEFCGILIDHKLKERLINGWHEKFATIVIKIAVLDFFITWSVN